MPIYTYHCENCEHEFDKRQSFSEEALVVCPNCHKHQLRKVYSPAGVVFKGSGFYVTDKKKSTAKKPAKKTKSNGKAVETGTKSETKSEGNKKEGKEQTDTSKSKTSEKSTTT